MAIEPIKIEITKRDIRDLIQRRNETDRILSAGVYIGGYAAALVLEVILFVVATIAMIPPPSAWGWKPPDWAFVAMGLGYIFLFIATAILLIALYRLIERRNKHFKRQELLGESIVGYLEATKGERKELEVKIGDTKRTLREAKLEETEKPAALWIILTFITFGIAGLYVYYFLMRDFCRHERRENYLLDDLKESLKMGGIDYKLPRRGEEIPDRNFWLYFILAIVTLGLFGIYWIYILFTDPNKHFKHHQRWEDELLISIQQEVPEAEMVATEKTSPEKEAVEKIYCRNCGAENKIEYDYCRNCGTKLKQE